VAVVLACCALSAAMYFADRNKFPGRAAVNWYNLGELYFEQGRYAEAQAAYSRSLALNPNQGYTALGACKLFVARRQPERAVDLVRRIRPMMDEELKRDFLREPHLAVIRKDLRRILEETDVEPTREP
jgi:cytochrome c-type biogenesis protein CcmH/NrfG